MEAGRVDEERAPLNGFDGVVDDSDVDPLWDVPDHTLARKPSPFRAAPRMRRKLVVSVAIGCLVFALFVALLVLLYSGLRAGAGGGDGVVAQSPNDDRLIRNIILGNGLQVGFSTVELTFLGATFWGHIPQRCLYPPP